MCCEDDSIICDILVALSGCCFCYWWNAIRNEKPPEKELRRIKSVSAIQSLGEDDVVNENIIYAKKSQSKYILPVDIPSDVVNENIIYAKKSQSKYILPVDIPSKHDNIKSVYPQYCASVTSEKIDHISKGIQINTKVLKSPLRSEKIGMNIATPRQLASRNSEKFLIIER